MPALHLKALQRKCLGFDHTRVCCSRTQDYAAHGTIVGFILEQDADTMEV